MNEMITLTVDGKKRAIRGKSIRYQTDHDLECVYMGHTISISEQDTGGFYAVVMHIPSGMYAVDGYYGGQYCRYGIETLEDCLAMCIRNILI